MPKAHIWRYVDTKINYVPFVCAHRKLCVRPIPTIAVIAAVCAWFRPPLPFVVIALGTQSLVLAICFRHPVSLFLVRNLLQFMNPIPRLWQRWSPQISANQPACAAGMSVPWPCSSTNGGISDFPYLHILPRPDQSVFKAASRMNRLANRK